MSFFGSVLGGVLVMLIGWTAELFWNKLWKKRKGYLLYEVRKFKLQDNETIEVLSIWNPTKKDICKDEITKDFELISQINSITLLSVANKSCECLSLQENGSLKLSFENFSSEAGCVYVLKSRYGVCSSLMTSGEVNSNKILFFQDFIVWEKYTIVGYLFLYQFLMLLTWVVLKIIGFSFTIVYIIQLMQVAALVPTFFIHHLILRLFGKPKSLINSFDGK